ncbi:hypothetical protein MILUP08_43741 [Micromonospora lupini str. Lupac 08]|uniref:Uncharacterized protein n=1 Tax=Micromonospora lupini str. Lupac 08 TaxID=1150864 RepID=I0L4T2_9ACTN|nr:hypothetical protein MILUP08_43741 [Micromonospora lupini str. Lupac 08]
MQGQFPPQLTHDHRRHRQLRAALAGGEPEPLPGRGLDDHEIVLAEMGIPIPQMLTAAGGKPEVGHGAESARGAVAAERRPVHAARPSARGASARAPTCRSGVAAPSG